MVYVDIDIDIWRYGRNPNGKLDNQYLRNNYPYVELTGLPKFNKNQVKTLEILKDHFEPDHNMMYPFMLRHSFVFFQEHEQAELFRGLLYVY
ncbi:hypothetical protein NKJ04_17355 [Mesorhizobium sp. M0618]|uniref:hypothetical protein n=1 Tax=Mesorhizobium sp. M0618 TaxID=2956972 RepID=UPI00333C9D9D